MPLAVGAISHHFRRLSGSPIPIEGQGGLFGRTTSSLPGRPARGARPGAQVRDSNVKAW